MYKTLLQYHPVGQGCFYTGQIYAGQHRLFNFVYDCGTNSDQDYITGAINNSPVKKRVGSKINVCIISHFHHDHTSGIPQLLRGTPCDRLVIPYYEPIERLIIYLESNNTDEDYRRMMEDPYRYFSGDEFEIGEIIVVGGGPDNQTLVPGRPVAPRPENDNNFKEERSFGKNREYEDDWQDDETNHYYYQQLADREPGTNLQKISLKIIPYQMRTPLYKFIFYCRTMEGGSDADAKLKIEQLKILINTYFEEQRIKSRVTEFKDLFDKLHLKEISRIYGSVFGGAGKLNGTSLAVYHQSTLSPEEYTPLQTMAIRFPWPGWHRMELGSLLTGDLDLETKEKLELFQDYFQHYLARTGYFQVMHHGSDRNWPFGIPSSNLHTFPAYIINHGAGRAHHPGKEVGKLLRRHRPRHVFLNNEFTPVIYGYYFHLR